MFCWISLVRSNNAQPVGEASWNLVVFRERDGSVAARRARVGPMRVPCVGAIVRDQADRLLVIQRANPPAAGRWSIPGGRVERGESDGEALLREMAEETGLVIDVGDMVGTVEREGPGGSVYVIHDYSCIVIGGELTPGDDAADARWVTEDELAGLECSPGLRESLRDWGVLHQ
jgi:8-oxo-dGTP diphosphatase